VIALPTVLVRNVGRATEAIIEIRDQLGSLVDLPREILEQLRAMQEVAERMHRTAEEIHEIAQPMLETAQGIQAVAQPMLDTGAAATKAAEEARDAVLRTNELIERTLKLAAPIEAVQERGERMRSRWRRRGESPG
jgi:methyl-accepting chemotaxis protein